MSVSACLCISMSGVHRGPKRMLGFLELELISVWELPCRFWELNLAPLEELVLLPAEPSIQLLL